jgi:hypothetical protein
MCYLISKWVTLNAGPCISCPERIQGYVEQSLAGSANCRDGWVRYLICPRWRSHSNTLQVLPPALSDYTPPSTLLYIRSNCVDSNQPRTIPLITQWDISISIDHILTKYMLFLLHNIINNPGGPVDIATCYGLEGPGIEFRWREIFRTCPDRPWGSPSLLYNR